MNKKLIFGMSKAHLGRVDPVNFVRFLLDMEKTKKEEFNSLAIMTKEIKSENKQRI
jgi:hypothetical protein